MHTLSKVQRLKGILPQIDNVEQVGQHEYKHMYTIPYKVTQLIFYYYSTYMNMHGHHHIVLVTKPQNTHSR